MSRIRGVVVKASDPTVGDDSTKGFFEGFKWVNSATKSEFTCDDPAVGAAVWNPIINDATEDTNTSVQSLGAAFAVLTGMTRSLAAGTYIIQFSGEFITGDESVGELAIFSGGVQVGGAAGYTRRRFGGAVSGAPILTWRGSVATQAMITLGSTTTVDIRGREIINTVVAFDSGSMIAIKLS